MGTKLLALIKPMPLAAILTGIILLLIISCGKGKSQNLAGSAFVQSNERISAEHNAATRNVELASVIEEVRDCEVPEGVEPDIFNLLRDALISELEKRGLSRVTSAAPTGSGNEITDLAFNPETFELTWSYKNLGDYDLSGEVGVPDITKIAQHYNKIIEGEGFEQDFLGWVDGSGNGEIGIPDVTPIATHYLSLVDGYSIRASESGVVNWEEVAYFEYPRGPLSAPFPPEGEFPVMFTFDASQYAGTFLMVVPLDNAGEEGLPSPIIRAEAPPQIRSVSPVAGQEYKYATFAADVIGSPPLVFLWDFGGASDTLTSAEVSPQVRLAGTGTYTVSLQVTNDFGTAVKDFEIAVSEGTGAPAITIIPNTTGMPNQIVTLEVEAIGELPFTYSWDFGGGATPGESTDEFPSVLLGAPGEYTGTVAVTNSIGTDEVNFTLTIEEPGSVFPKAVVTATPIEGTLPLTVKFDASASYGINELELFLWRMDDGTIMYYDTGAERTFEFEFKTTTAKKGAVSPWVVVYDSKGNSSQAMVDLFLNTEPSASLSVSPRYARVDEDVLLNASNSNDDTGQIVKFEWDLDGDEVFELDTDAEPTTSARFDAPGTYIVRVQVTDNYGASDSRGTSIFVEYNHLPRFTARCDKPAGIAPFATEFVIESATDPDGTLALFEIDYDGDGVFDESAPLMQNFTHVYASAGEFTAKIRVTDNDGGFAEKTFDIKIYDDWVILTLDDNGNVGEFPSLALIEGVPAVSYRNATNSSLKFIKATSVSGTAWHSPITIESSGQVRDASALLFVGSVPAIGYSGSGGLKYIVAQDLRGLDWYSPTIIDSFNTSFTGISGAIIGGNPAFSYIETTRKYLRYIRAENQMGSSWAAPLVVAADGGKWKSTSLAYVNGAPAIAYGNYGLASIEYKRALDIDGISWPDVSIRVDGNFSGWGSYSASMAVIGGNPVVAYRTGIIPVLSSTVISIRSALDSVGENWNFPIKDLDKSIMQEGAKDICSLANIGGKPAITYYDGQYGDLRYIEALDAAGSEWLLPVVLDGGDDVGYHSSLVSLGGKPAVAYYDMTNGSLKFAVRTG